MKKYLFLVLLLSLAARTEAVLVNVALDAPAYVNAPLYGADTIARLTDGVRNLQIHGDVAPPTGFAYWIDLGESKTINNIKIWPRQDGCCRERFSKVRVSIHDDDPRFGSAVWQADLFADGTSPDSAAGTVVTVTAGMGTGTFAGRWVQLTALADPVPSYALQVNELEVYAEGAPNVALGAAVTSSAPLYGGASPAALVNGNRSDTIHGDVSIAPGYHYDLNLGAEATIDRIKIIARQDGLVPERLSNYRVSIHQDDAGVIGSEVWSAGVHTDLGNPGSGPGAKDVLTGDLAPFDDFVGQWIRIESLDNPVPNYALQMTEVEVYGTLAGGPILRIVQQPQNVVSTVGRTVIFNFGAVAAGGDPALLTFQWKKNGTDIPGATSGSYTTPPITTADGTNLFQCVASYPGLSSVTSDAAGITIDYAFGAAAFANGPLWGPGGWNISLIVDGNHDADGVFRGVHGDATLPLGFAYWFDMHTKVIISNIVVWPRHDTCCVGRLTNYRISVHDDDNGMLGAEVWGADLHTDGSNAGGGPGVRDVINGDLDPGGVFEGRWVKIQSLENPVPSYALQLTEIEVFGSVPPEVVIVILQQPVNTSSSPFRTATFRTAATVLNGNPANLGYQWQRNGENIPGATDTSYTTPPLCADDEGARYRCVISYPEVPAKPTEEAVLAFDFNYARSSQAFTSQPLWGPGGWNISMLVDGDRQNVFHGDTGIQPGFAYTVNMGFPVDIDRIDIYPRQDRCPCAERFTKLRVSVHDDDGNGAPGNEVWGVDLFTDGTNPGDEPGTVVSLTADQDSFGVFSGQWIKITSLEDPVQSYALQMTELEVIGKARALCHKRASDGRLVLSWDNGILQSALNVTGPWDDVPAATNPFTVSFTGQRQFYRLRAPSP